MVPGNVLLGHPFEVHHHPLRHQPGQAQDLVSVRIAQARSGYQELDPRGGGKELRGRQQLIHPFVGRQLSDEECDLVVGLESEAGPCLLGRL